jgi:hypothetical protein
MAEETSYCVEFISGHNVGRRALAWLINSSKKAINAKAVFEKLADKDERDLRRRFDYWLDGGRKDNWFHGFPNSQDHKRCFVFKLKNSRFYGFLCNPDDNHPNFLLCVLIIHAKKNQWETDLSELDRICEFRDNQDVQAKTKIPKEKCSN